MLIGFDTGIIPLVMAVASLECFSFSFFVCIISNTYL